MCRFWFLDANLNTNYNQLISYNIFAIYYFDIAKAIIIMLYVGYICQINGFPRMLQNGAWYNKVMDM